ncbi:S24 family peptidase [Rhodoblastus sp.]|uniref:S24 family peptidase n=1 Tax=Rhodoblastus sp. TaxID=1962975 RepID=UPI0031450341
MSDWLSIVRTRIAEAIGGRSGALAFEKATGGRFRRTTVQRWIDGGTWPDLAEMTEFAAATGRPVEWFLGTEAPKAPEPPGTVIVPVLDVHASAGPGRVADVVRAEAEFAFPLYFLRRLIGDRASSAKLESLRAHGDSMAPTIANGALLIVDRSQRDLPQPVKNGPKTRRPLANAPIFVFYQGEDLRLKRLRPVNEKLVAVISDNIEEYPVEIVQPGADGALKIIGKVIWWDNRL